MGSMTTFGAFTSARLGMYASMKGLDVTGHNIANINTRGYSRQSLDQISLRFKGSDKYASFNDARVGTGVLTVGISQLRDPYLDIRFRNEQASVGSMDAKLSALDDLQRIFDEVGKNDSEGVLEKQFKDLMTQLQNLSSKVGQSEYDTLVRSSASTLITLLNKAATSLEKSEAQQETFLEQDVKSVNSILEKIRDLNDSIRKSDIHGDPALEMRDQRNLLLDELSQYMKVDISYGTESVGAGSTVQKLIVSLPDGTKLIDGQYGTQLSIQQMPQPNPNYDPAITDITNAAFGQYLQPDGTTGTNDPDLANQVNDTHFSMQLAALENRGGDVMTGSTDTSLGHTALGGSIDATREMLTAGGEFNVAGNPNTPTVRGIPYYRNSLDALANKFASVLNDANHPYQVDGAGNYLDAAGATIEDPDDPTKLLNNKQPLTATQKAKLEAPGGGHRLGNGIPLFSNSSAGDDATGITAKNISISKSWMSGATQITASAVNDPDYSTSSANDNILHIISLINGDQEYKPSDVVNGSSNVTYYTGSFQNMFTNTAATLANDVKTTTTMLNNYAANANELDMSRDSVSGVDLNDEAANMMQYQKSYAAACRMMTTIDEAIDKLINGTGVVGR